ncbi:sensor histidine kinase [Pedobacter psychroterrae]|uniref:histidine kinase n=1 Tax=Pedobacter psychroterrae TaxID=2530453 RepID=A0A4R0NI25_9SPHI|nr:sensor histidine kinase [Pedobacter psychroterrae]TCC99002.1 sensor histidine kinase [Pedobacter psychroterrae]
MIIGTLVVVILVVFLFFFVIIYQRKMLTNQVAIQKLQKEKQRELLNAVFETQESERKRLSEDLHDSVGQVLSAIKLNLYRLNTLGAENNTMSPVIEDTRALAEECILEIRNIIQNVLPPLLTDFGLGEALADLCAKMQSATGIQVECKIDALPGRYEPIIEVTLYRIVQELFGNATKHAQASEIKVSLIRQEGGLEIYFKDNGIGFNKNEAKPGFGLKNMQSRMQLIKGELEITSEPGKGTAAFITLKI